MTLDLDTLAKWGPLALSAVIIPALKWVVPRGLVTHDQLEAFKKAHDAEHRDIDRRLRDGDTKFNDIKKDIEYLPTREDIDDLRDRLTKVDVGVARLEGKIQVVAVRVGAVEKPVDLLVEHHLEEDDRK